MAQGLLRQAGVSKEDSCLGLGDGAAWVQDLLTDLGTHHILLDVFHATSYLDKILQALHFSDSQRLEERQRWFKGTVDGAQWLQAMAATYNLTDTVIQSWNKDAREAWAYLQRNAKLGALDYPRFKAQGWSIASANIESYNKWAIAQRMKCAGMNWSKQGLKRMAFLRSEFASSKPITSFHRIRLSAFSP